MLKIGQYTYNYGGAPVELNNKINIPVPETEDELSEEEKERIAEEKRKEEEKIRFNNAVEERVNSFITAQQAAINKEAERILADANAQAQKLTEDTRAAAKNVLDKAAAEGEKIKEQAQKDGYAAGFELGKSEAKKKCESYLEAAGQFLGEINSKKEAYFISNEHELRETVYTVAEKIVLAQLDKDDKVIDRIVGNAAKAFRNSDYIKVSVMGGEVSKEFRTDADYVKGLVMNIPDIEVEYLDKEEYPKGTVILDNDHEIVDASVPTQLEFLKEILRRTRGSEE